MRYGHVGYGLWITDYASAFLFRAAGELITFIDSSYLKSH